MKNLILFASIMGLAGTCYAQKPLVNDTSYLSWTTVDNGNISPDGKYAYYRITNEPAGGNTWVILSTDKKWEIRSIKYENLNFSTDSKYLYAMQGDSLVKLKLRDNQVEHISKCKGYELYSKGKSDWLIYGLDDKTSFLVIENLKTRRKQVLSNIQEYSLNENGVAIVSKLKTSDENQETMQWTDLNTGVSKIIYKGMSTKNLIYDLSGNHVAFAVSDSHNKTQIWYYDRNMKKAQYLASDSTVVIAPNVTITTDETWRFSEDGQDLFLNLSSKIIPEGKKNTGPVIWNYNDLYLLSEYKKMPNNLHEHENLSILHVSTGKIRQLLSGDQKIVFESPIRKNSDVLIVQSSKGNLDELPWNKNAHLSYYLCFTKTGKLVPIKENCTHWIDVMALSPNNDFLVYYDPEQLQYLSYDIKTERTEIISGPLKKELFTVRYSTISGPGVQEGTFGIVGWIDGEKKIIVHGKYDLWELDLENKSKPTNITNKIGDKNQVIFANLENKVLNSNNTWILSAFNMRTKDGEIYSFNYKKRNLTLLFKTPTSFARSPTDNIKILIKAKNSKNYLLKLGNTQSSPNYVYTSDFKKLDTLSASYPEQKYNWLSIELATYYDQNGRECQGILYKPENFVPLQKYPVILFYYLESANQLNQAIGTEPNSVGINIPILVSNGYIVFRPNIYIEANRPGVSALTSVLAAVDHLKTFPWVDSSKIGIVGHSRGGYETNFIVTHTNKFSAAISASGISNLVEYYNTRNGLLGKDNHNYVRTSMMITYGLDVTPDIYNVNSPILAVKNLSTPLLMMHNEDDNLVSVSQSTEFFVQLRNMKRPVWLLQYNDESHDLSNSENRIDFQNKVKDFFDHYLKDKPLPAWMNNPIK